MFRYVTIDKDELEQIKDKLGAALDTYLGKRTVQSDIDTLRVTKSVACADLSQAAEFQTLAVGYEPAAVDWVFTHPVVGDVHVKVSTVNGSVWFRNAVPEKVIDDVLEVIREVKRLA